MLGFETHPEGTADTIRELRLEVERLNRIEMPRPSEPFPRDPPAPPDLFDARGRRMPLRPAPNPVPSDGRAFGGEAPDRTGWWVMAGVVVLVVVVFGLGFAAGAGHASSPNPAACSSR